MKHEYRLPGEEGDLHVIPVSGGIDSKVLTAVLHERFPETDFRMVFTDTLAEDPSIPKSLHQLEDYLGKPILWLIPDKGLQDLVEGWGGFLPGHRSRYCTKHLKSEPFLAWLEANRPGEGRIHVYIGLRADEMDRLGLISHLDFVEQHTPFRDHRLRALPDGGERMEVVMSIRIYNSPEELRRNPPGPDEIFVYRDEMYEDFGPKGLDWCVAQTKHNPENGETLARDLGVFYERQNALVFAVAFGRPALLNAARECEANAAGAKCLKPYRVALDDHPEQDSDFVFECMAQDEDHAREQAINAYPDSNILEVEELEHEGCIQVEYDPAYWGGDYAGTGSFFYLPLLAIRHAEAKHPEANREDHIHEAFREATGFNPVHIINYSQDLYTRSGDPYPQ
jgi:hypothetical protein